MQVQLIKFSFTWSSVTFILNNSPSVSCLHIFIDCFLCSVSLFVQMSVIYILVKINDGSGFLPKSSEAISESVSLQVIGECNKGSERPYVNKGIHNK